MSDYRDSAGFGRPVQATPAVFSVKGPDDLDHAMGCDFIRHKGITPCSCDATRSRIVPGGGSLSWWWQCWFRWQEARVANVLRQPERVPWPVKGPDDDPWIGGIDFDDGPAAWPDPEEEFFPCVCCGVNRQAGSTGFCERCNDSNCALIINAGTEPDGGT